MAAYRPDTQEDVKRSVRAASTANVTISSPGSSIDGVTLASGDRVLLKNQSSGAENGIYYFNGAASAMTRARDADQTAEVTSGMQVDVEEGTVNNGRLYILSTANPITIGSTALVFDYLPDASEVATTVANSLKIGTLSARPAANTVPAGARYFATDTVADYISDASNWIRVSESAGTESGYAGIKGTAPAGKVFQDGSAISRTGANADLFSELTIARSGTKNGTAIITGLSQTSDLQAGMQVEGTGVTAGTVINSVDSGSQVTLSISVSGSGAVALTFFSHGVGNGSTTFNVPDRQGRGLVGLGTHTDINQYTDNDGLTLANRTPKHVHDMSSHTHDMNSHTHNMNSHTHDMNSHTHTLGSHTHGMQNHVHGTSTLITGNNTNGSSNTTTGGAATRAGSPHTHGISNSTDAPNSNTTTGPTGGSDGPSTANTLGPSTASTLGPSTANTLGPSTANTASGFAAHGVTRWMMKL